MQKVLVICGPTCVGKTSLSIKLAKLLNGEIINGDSMQVYKHMDIGTAKIKENEKDGVIHHLFDFKELDESYSVAEYQKLVREKIEEVSNKNKLPILVGGTGLYLKAALYDYSFKEKEDHVNYGLEDKSNEEIYALLSSLDNKTAKTIHINNRKRVIRAIEIYYENGIGKEDINKLQTHSPIYDVYYLGLRRDRKELYKLIDERVDQMIKEGLINEVKYVYEHSSYPSTCMQAIGYKEFIDYFEGKATLEYCIQRVKFNTHQYVKRQFTWFNHQINVNWVDVDNLNSDEIVQSSLDLLKDFINGK